MVLFEEFKRYPIVHGISDRHLKLEDFVGRLEIKGLPLVRMGQPHKGKILKVDSKACLSEKLEDYDGAVTNLKDVALMVLTADCLPILLFDPIKNIIGIAHAGWRGTSEGIAKNIVNAMKSSFKSDPSQIFVGLGPSIRQCCYEVSSEFLMYFPDSVVKMAHKYYFDLVNENANQLLSAGINSRNIFDCAICTSCRNNDFYSYRKEKEKAGRMASIVMLKTKE